MSVPSRYAHLVGAKFTSDAPIGGWRQFHVLGLKRLGSGYEAELQASCDPKVRAWVAARALLRREGWTPGWRLRSELVPHEA